MGYTHYWTPNTKSTPEERAKLISFVEEAIKQFGSDRIAGDTGEEGTSPELTEKCIRFNGLADDSYETFPLHFDEGTRETCKTSRKPYDALVVACLHYAKDINIISSWSSDGFSEDGDFDEGLKLYFNVLHEQHQEELKLLELHSPDTIAECYDGVSKDLYAHIWNVVLPSYEADELKLPQDGDAKFYRSLEPNGTGWLCYVDEKFRKELLDVARLNNK